MNRFYSLWTRERRKRTLVTDNNLTDRLQRNHRNLISEIGTARKASRTPPASSHPMHRLPSLSPAIRKLLGLAGENASAGGHRMRLLAPGRWARFLQRAAVPKGLIHLPVLPEHCSGTAKGYFPDLPEQRSGRSIF
ncbi:hypothetical protein AVEN_86410-1 [Araneus ventricosus]|uniref:Uncharacterized protein n=1 Tax=Araneus ventricosus TaxID=182803 RepID=A0A4Y2RXH1_ARAVE|nr:hypothetical protein AVEN_86410-1 [Araneus ventricosus]